MEMETWKVHQKASRNDEFFASCWVEEASVSSSNGVGVRGRVGDEGRSQSCIRGRRGREKRRAFAAWSTVIATRTQTNKRTRWIYIYIYIASRKWTQIANHIGAKHTPTGQTVVPKCCAYRSRHGFSLGMCSRTICMYVCVQEHESDTSQHRCSGRPTITAWSHLN